LNTRN